MSVGQWADLDYEQVHSGKQFEQEPRIVHELKAAGVRVGWGGSHGVEFEDRVPTPPRYVPVPALYVYTAPRILLWLERWHGDDQGIDLAAWAGRTFSPRALGTMYALHDQESGGDWYKYLLDRRTESKHDQANQYTQTKGKRR